MKILSDGSKSVNLICDEFAASKHAEQVKNSISNEIYYVSINVIEVFIKDTHCIRKIILCLFNKLDERIINFSFQDTSSLSIPRNQ